MDQKDNEGTNISTQPSKSLDEVPVGGGRKFEISEYPDD